MKSSKSNTKISVAAIFFLRHPLTIYQPTFTAYLNSFSASRYNYNGHRESAHVMVNRINPTEIPKSLPTNIGFLSAFLLMITDQMSLDNPST